MKAKGIGMRVRGRAAINARILLMWFSLSVELTSDMKILSIPKDVEWGMNVNEHTNDTDGYNDLLTNSNAYWV